MDKRERITDLFNSGVSLQAIGNLLGITRQRAHQLLIKDKKNIMEKAFRTDHLVVGDEQYPVTVVWTKKGEEYNIVATINKGNGDEPYTGSITDLYFQHAK